MNNNGYHNINSITPIITIYSASIMPWFLIGLQAILIAVYLENRSWKYGHLSPTEKYDEHVLNIQHCECIPPSSDPYLQKHTERPLMSGIEMWEGFVYGLPTLVFFTYFAFKLSSYQHKFRQNTQRILARQNAGITNPDDDETFRYLQQEKEANQQMISRILWFIITPILICVKLSFGLKDEINWYVVISPFIVLCIVYMTEGFQNKIWWFREQGEVNQMINEVNVGIIMETGRNRGLNEYQMEELHTRLKEENRSLNINNDDDDTNSREKQSKEEEEEKEKRKKEEEDEKLKQLNIFKGTF